MSHGFHELLFVPWTFYAQKEAWFSHIWFLCATLYIQLSMYLSIYLLYSIYKTTIVYVNIAFMNKKWYNKTMKIKGFDVSLILSLMDTMVSLIVKVLMK